MEIKFEHIITAVVAVGAYILYQKKIAGTASQSAAGKTITPANTLLNKIVTGDLPGSSRGSKPIALDFSPYLDSKTGQWIVGQEADSKPIYAGDMISPPAHALGPESFKDLPNDWLVQLNFNQPDNKENYPASGPDIFNQAHTLGPESLEWSYEGNRYYPVGSQHI